MSTCAWGGVGGGEGREGGASQGVNRPPEGGPTTAPRVQTPADIRFNHNDSRRRLISAIRDSDTGGASGRSALEQEFDRAIEDELEQIDTRGLFAGTVRGKGKIKRGQRDVSYSS